MSKVFAFHFSAKDGSGLGWILFSLIFFFYNFIYLCCLCRVFVATRAFLSLGRGRAALVSVLGFLWRWPQELWLPG